MPVEAEMLADSMLSFTDEIVRLARTGGQRCARPAETRQGMPELGVLPYG